MYALGLQDALLSARAPMSPHSNETEQLPVVVVCFSYSNNELRMTRVRIYYDSERALMNEEIMLDVRLFCWLSVH